MKNGFFQIYGSNHENGDPNEPELRVWMRPFPTDEERDEIVKKAEICSQFGMAFRGLVEFYGDDLIAYKQKIGTNKYANAFLRTFAAYINERVDNHNPSSWKECQPAFWEELIFAHFPTQIKIGTKQKESELFLIQLKKFVRWLDKQAGCSWYPTVEKMAEEARAELNTCEQLLDDFTLSLFPDMHRQDWNPKKELDNVKQTLQSSDEVHNSIFKITAVAESFITVTDIDSTRTFEITGLPPERLEPGILLEGFITRDSDDFFWTWQFTETVYSGKAEKYFQFVG